MSVLSANVAGLFAFGLWRPIKPNTPRIFPCAAKSRPALIRHRERQMHSSKRMNRKHACRAVRNAKRPAHPLFYSLHKRRDKTPVPLSRKQTSWALHYTIFAAPHTTETFNMKAATPPQIGFQDDCPAMANVAKPSFPFKTHSTTQAQ